MRILLLQVAGLSQRSAFHNFVVLDFNFNKNYLCIHNAESRQGGKWFNYYMRQCIFMFNFV